VAMLHNIATSRNGKLSIYGNSASFAYPYYLINFNDSRYPLYAINLKDKSNPSLVSTMIYNPKYNSSDNSKIYYNISSNSPFHNYKLNSANTTYYGTVTSGKFIFTPSLNTADYGKSVNIYIVNKTNSVIIPGVSYEYAYQKPGILLQNELVIFFGILLIPIMGIFSAYFYYGKDKTSGVLESIIARPITKGKLMISRLIANSVSFLIGLIISMGFADIILEHYTGVFISSETFLVIIFGYLVEAIGFAGLVYLISQFEKSQGQVLGTGIGLLFVLGFMWKIITHGMLFLFHIHPGTGYYKDLVILNSISPSYYPNILAYYHTGLYATLHASSVGINIYSVIIVGLIWTIVPALTALYFARKRD
jgi:ABC-2 type transport system permease protein